MDIFKSIDKLVAYGVVTELIDSFDIAFQRNAIMEILNLDGPGEEDYNFFELEKYMGEVKEMSEDELADELEVILGEILDYAAENKLIPENTITYRDLFDTKIMASLVAKPSQVINNFYKNYAVSPTKATDYYYKLSKDSNYNGTKKEGKA